MEYPCKNSILDFQKKTSQLVVFLLTKLWGTDFDFFSEETADNFGAHCQHCHWCFTRWKDYVIPGFVEAWVDWIYTWWFGWLIELMWFWKRILMLMRLYIIQCIAWRCHDVMSISLFFYRSIIDRSYISGTSIRMILLMKEILHQLMCRIHHYLQCFYLSQVVQDFFHQQYLTNIRRYILIELIVSVVRFFPIKKNTKEKWSIEKMRQLEKPHRERKYTACYWGETTCNTLTRWWFSFHFIYTPKVWRGSPENQPLEKDLV